MICNIQDTLQIDLPDKHQDIVTAYNTEWDKANGQGWELKNFIELTKDRKSLFDIGGNIGFFSLVFCLNNNTDNKKRAYCFEPSPFGLSTAVEILDHNDWFDRIKLFPLFVGDKEDNVEILMEDTKTFVVLFEKTDENHGIIDRGGRAAGTMVSLDNFTWLAEMGSEEEKYGLDLIFEDERKKVHHNYLGFKEEFDVDTIKIDVEGYEYKVLRGAKETLKKYKPLMFLEIHQHLLKLYDADIMDVYAILKDCKYKIYDIHNNQVKDEEQYNNLFQEAGEIRVVCKGD
jgi:FkbM family methyltransferase